MLYAESKLKLYTSEKENELIRFRCEASQLASAFLGDRFGLCVTTVPVARLGFRRNTVECKESRLGKQPIEVPSNVVITLQGQDMKVKGPFGELALSYLREIMIDRQHAILKVCKAVETRRANQMHGLFRSKAEASNKRISILAGHFISRQRRVFNGFLDVKVDGFTFDQLMT